MPLIACESGIIKIIASPGSILQIGQIIATLELDDPSQIKTATPFDKDFTKLLPPIPSPVKIDKKLEEALQLFEYMLDGYIGATNIDNEYVKNRINDMMVALRDPRLPADEFFTALYPLNGRIPSEIYNKFKEIGDEFCLNLQTNPLPWEKPSQFPTEKNSSYY